MEEQAIGPDQFRCYVCKGVFNKEWTDKQSIQELHDNFGPEYSPEDCVAVCDDCYKKFMEGDDV